MTTALAAVEVTWPSPGSVLARRAGQNGAWSTDALESFMATDRDFDDVFRTSYPRLVRLLTAATNDAELAADCVQEAFVRAHTRWRRVGAYDDPVGWVRRVALNLVKDQAKRSARKRRAEDRLAAAGHAEQQAWGPVDQPVDLLAAVAELPAQQRMAVVLHYIEGLPVRETASEMGVSEGVVKFHLHAGRNRLRQVLDMAREGDR